ncbi:hypothetical protein IE81DRAFT_186323 [Ceraceosorus guamensis]|uniref:Uncharacterized protein n=1 Tax=Ceraceosorus guamensis TaxID=1522189 RepID=A0A316VUH7_9BASI|nr:hypothetical protein IE81DRAFT_186323 [Ceraceosorus guamensis]PWN41142.1 hypothetical protein IE81DRAFT_186323 [Ceraceosorus guamensis]
MLYTRVQVLDCGSSLPMRRPLDGKPTARVLNPQNSPHSQASITQSDSFGRRSSILSTDCCVSMTCGEGRSEWLRLAPALRVYICIRVMAVFARAYRQRRYACSLTRLAAHCDGALRCAAQTQGT